MKGYNVNVPEPKQEQIPISKKTVYEKAQLESSAQTRTSLSDFAGELMKANVRKNSDAGSNENMGKTGKSNPSEKNIYQSAKTYKQVTEQVTDFYKPTKEQQSHQLEKKVDELLARLKTQQEMDKQQNRQEQMMERSYQMAARYLNPPANQPQEPVSTEDKDEVVTVQSVDPNPISSLSGQLADSSFPVSVSERRNYGFNTAVGANYRMGANSIAACISEDQTLVQGQRVRMRLLQAMQAGNVIVPAGSTVIGSANMQGERLEINIQSLEYGGNILPVDMTVYDTDGQRGLFVPGSEDRNAAKQALADMGNNMGNSVSITHSAGQQVAMDLSRGLIQSGTQLLSKKIRTVRITLKAGYKVLLVPKRS